MLRISARDAQPIAHFINPDARNGPACVLLLRVLLAPELAAAPPSRDAGVAGRLAAAAAGRCGAASLARDGSSDVTPSASWKKLTRCSIACDCCSKALAAAAFCSTRAEFCCVAWSICVGAVLTWSMPVDCSPLAEAISETISATFLIEPTISVSAPPALLTSSTPCCTWPELLVIRSLMSFAAGDERCARLPTYHGEAAAGFAGPRRFHRSVERQQVGLPGDLVDHADDVGDLT